MVVPLHSRKDNMFMTTARDILLYEAVGNVSVSSRTTYEECMERILRRRL
jgi:hypothetical protein